MECAFIIFFYYLAYKQTSLVTFITHKPIQYKEAVKRAKINKRLKTNNEVSFKFSPASTYFPTLAKGSIIGVRELDFQVR
ncbi:hypothetical protein, partial [Helicobacter felis]|uniref:hypothetical protein n=1 Tax=Helicobacter felis TaxID=214 RepID=UPI001969EC59